MRKSGRLFILLGVALALVAALLAIVAFSDTFSGESKDENQIAEAPVVVAARDVPANTILTQEDIQVVSVDPSTIAPGTASTANQVLGLAVAGDLVKGQQIISGNLISPGLTFDVAEGKRAMAIPVDRVNALGGMIRPEDRIDLIYSIRLNLTRVVPSEPMEVRDNTEGYADDDTLVLPPMPGPGVGQTYPYPGEPGSRFIVEDNTEGSPVTKIVIQDVRVLRVIAGDTTVASDGSDGTTATDAQAQEASTAPQGAAEKLPNADLLVLEVDPQQAEVIKFLMDNDGRYHVAVRPKDDAGVATTNGVTYDQLVTEYGLPVPKTVRLPGGGQ